MRLPVFFQGVALLIKSLQGARPGFGAVDGGDVIARHMIALYP